MIGQAFHLANLALALLLELCALGALAYWGVRTGGGPVTKTVLSAQNDSAVPKKRFRASAVCSGASSGKKCPASRACPLTSSPQARQSPTGPDSSTYQVPSAP